MCESLWFDTITGEDEEEESELEYLTEIREVRDKQPELFARIKRLPKKGRSTKLLSIMPDGLGKQFPSLLAYQGDPLVPRIHRG